VEFGLAKHKSGLTVAFDPIKYTILAIGQLYPDLSATVHYMDEQFFQDNGILEWATAESNGRHVIFVNPFRTLTQIATAIAKGAVVLHLGIDEVEFDEASVEFTEELLKVGQAYKNLIAKDGF
jgi:hypothetical protein